MKTPLNEIIEILKELGYNDVVDIVKNKIIEEKKLIVKSWNHGYDTRKNGLEWDPITFVETLYINEDENTDTKVH